MTEREQPTTPSEPADILDTEPSMTQHPDPTADPTSYSTTDPTTDPATDPAAPATPDPTANLTPDPVGDPTTTIATQHTQAVPSPTPFRVEPATPVPDDVTSETAADTGETGDTAARLSHLPPPAPQSWGQGAAPQRTYAQVTVRKGPRPGAVVLGLLAMLVSAYVIVVNVSDASLEFRIVGPALIGALGGLLLLVGLAGVLIGRLRR
ncbi:hypothetical protein FHX52_2123 [Humibacillus xanthopallidus]|uniref:Uncharacterized protein n=1 Tax=Humibacillus xanthopallidus TaxID=412689 RepID=A0A543PY02_9MICO|nr:hypothetical protein [Humibacillus xanthopallidus]TQN48968.1 hypothetical protein FHX52_2123 [Humibacillus xanthopallidus]